MDWILIAGAVLYFAPGLNASLARHHNAAAIWALNILLGWTVLGWIAAMVWSFTAPDPSKRSPSIMEEWRRLRDAQTQRDDDRRD